MSDTTFALCLSALTIAAHIGLLFLRGHLIEQVQKEARKLREEWRADKYERQEWQRKFEQEHEWPRKLTRFGS